ncbi:MAG: hypothetical protein ABIR91_05490 [Candidatus Saccharimonadales bacterium]
MKETFSSPTHDNSDLELSSGFIRSSDEVDAYGSLGGGLPGPDNDDWRHGRAVDIQPKPAFFEQIANVTQVPQWQLEIKRAFDLKLDGQLTVDGIAGLKVSERQALAAAVAELCQRLVHRSNVLRVEGNYENPTFGAYEMESQQEANDYALQMLSLFAALEQQTVVHVLLVTHEMDMDNQSNQVRLNRQMKGRQIQFVKIDDDGKVTLVD